VLLFGLARVALAYSIGFGVDESYTIAISRRLDLSYFDHPPLHQWIAHFGGLLLGEGPALRLPFIALFAATGWLIFALTRALFGARAGFWATFALNATGFFLVSAGAWVVPDGPLLFALSGAALVFAKLLLGRPDARAAWRLWLAGGFWLGLAGLSKYNAVFFAIGLVIFIVLSPRQRRWLAHPAPYAAALVALAMIAPVIVWNAENGWISFAFQGGRGAAGAHWRPVQLGAMVLGEIAWLTPWIFVPLLGGLVAAIRLAGRDERRLFLLCLALPPIIVFTLTPLWGARGLPHWPMPGWLFAYPLLGVWLVEGWAERLNLRRWTVGSTALIALIVVALATQTTTGWITRALLPRGAVDPTLEALSWAPLASAPLIAASPPAFVVSTKWSDGGKIALALGPRVPVIVASDDPRGMAFLADPADFVGKDAVIVVPEEKLASATASLSPFFASLGAPQKLVLRRGQDEIALELIPAQSLTRPFPLPYPRRIVPNLPAKALQ
jgi:4-amino-4-deoxy-L-arabinose transferase-like glycosyltransferase